MIVVVGVPAWRAAEPAGPAGRACEIAIAAARAGARVELVGRTGDDAAGDALLIGLAQAGVGHAAMLRDASRATPIQEPGPPEDEAALHDRDDGTGAVAGSVTTAPAPAGSVAPAPAGPAAAPVLDPADVSLGLQYLTAFGVLVVTDDVPSEVLPVAAEAAGFAGAHLVVLVAHGGAAPASLPAAATVLAAPEEADEGAFGALVGAYAAALDAGSPPGEAFAAATGGAGWEALEA